MEFAIFTRWFVSANDNLNRKIYRNVLAPLTFHTTHFGHMNGTDRSTYRPKQSKKVRIFVHCQWYLFSLTYGVYRCWSAMTKQIPTTYYCQFECKTRYIAPRSRYISQMWHLDEQSVSLFERLFWFSAWFRFRITHQSMAYSKIRLAMQSCTQIHWFIKFGILLGFCSWKE